MRNLFACCGFALALLCSQPGAKGAVVVTVSETGTGVVAEGSGTLNLAALTLPASGADSPFLLPLFGEILVGRSSGGDLYTSVSGPTSFGTGDKALATSGSGDLFGVFGFDAALVVPKGYISGTALSGTAEWSGESFDSLGIIPGKYVWTWGTGATADMFTLQIGATLTPIPEPGTFGLFALTGLGLMLLRRRVRG